MIAPRRTASFAAAVVLLTGCALFSLDLDALQSDGGDSGDGATAPDAGADSLARDGPVDDSLTTPEGSADGPCLPVTLTAFDAPDGGWTLRGNAVFGGEAGTNAVALTPLDFFQAGAVWWRVPFELREVVATFGFRARRRTGFTNGDGATFAFVAGPVIPGVGDHGAGFGFCSLGGIAIAFDTYPNDDAELAPYVKVLQSTAGGSCTELASSAQVSALTDGNYHAIVVTWSFESHSLEVQIDGSRALAATPAVGPSDPSFVGFTGATGSEPGASDIEDPTVTISPVCR